MKQIIENVTERVCIKCNTSKLLDELRETPITKFNKVGRLPICKICSQKTIKEWYNNNRKSKNIKPFIEGKDIYGNETLTCVKCDTPKQRKYFYNSPIVRSNKTGKNRFCIECCLNRYPKNPKIKKIKTNIRNIDKPLTHEVIKGEKWKSPKGLAGRYLVSNYGRVFSFPANKVMETQYSDRGYCILKVSVEGKKHKKQHFIHRLVAYAFIPQIPNKILINHIDGVKHNNYYKNLEWCTDKENTDHAGRIGLRKVKVLKPKEFKVVTKAVAIYNDKMEYITSFKSMSDCAIHLKRNISSVSDSVHLGYKCNNHYVKFDPNYIHEKIIVMR